jgi:hypothetical protein
VSPSRASPPPSSPAPVQVSGGQSSNGASPCDPFAHLLTSLQEVQAELKQINFRTLSPLQCSALECWLLPLTRTCARGCRALKTRASFSPP